VHVAPDVAAGARPERNIGLTTKTADIDRLKCVDRVNVDARAVRYVRPTFGWGEAHNILRAVLQTATWI
jgi:hypothetical protein